ncbi:TM2 domain family protein [Cyanobium sp. NIES-981]|nr:TM2 domain family protein [Cyanobium sp. NIES-981]
MVLPPMATLSETELSNKKLAAGLTGIFLGAFGVHKFILGYTKAGVIMLVVSLAGGVVTCGLASFVMGVIGLIEGILYLTKTNEEFQATYIDGVKDWF